MALLLKFVTDVSASFDNTRKTFLVTDTTGDYDGTTNAGGWGTPNPAKGDVEASRLILSSWVGEQEADESSNVTTLMEVLREYLAKSSPITKYDTIHPKSALLGQTIIPLDDTSDDLLNSTEAKYTGRFLVHQLPSWITGSGSVVINNTDFGLTADTPFPDGYYRMQWKVYGGTNVTTGNLVQGTEYIVKGGDIAYNVANINTVVGGDFTSGETFIAGTETSFSGAGLVYPLIGNSTYSFLMYQGVQFDLNELRTDYYGGRCKCTHSADCFMGSLESQFQNYLAQVSPVRDSPTGATDALNKLVYDIANFKESNCNC